MSETVAAEAPSQGFEYAGLFYPWAVSTKGKDLILIDRISGMGVVEFFELIEDDYDMGRAPVTLALIATSIRARHPDRSVERILRTVMELDIENDIEMVGGGDSEEPIENPPAADEAESRSDVSPAESENSQDSTRDTSDESQDFSGGRGSATGSESVVRI
jgi:hypothetical protein